MTDNEIIKALEEMVEYPHYYEEGQILKNVLDLINRQQKEIERLTSYLQIDYCPKCDRKLTEDATTPSTHDAKQ